MPPLSTLAAGSLVGALVLYALTGGLFAKLRGPFRRERTFDSGDALKRHVAAYFTLTPEEFKVHCRTDSG